MAILPPLPGSLQARILNPARDVAERINVILVPQANAKVLLGAIQYFAMESDLELAVGGYFAARIEKTDIYLTVARVTRVP